MSDAKHRQSGIVEDAQHWPTMVKRGATGLNEWHTRAAGRTRRAAHRAPAHRTPTPLEAARARVALGPDSTWEEHWRRTFGGGR